MRELTDDYYGPPNRKAQLYIFSYIAENGKIPEDCVRASVWGWLKEFVEVKDGRVVLSRSGHEMRQNLWVS